MKYTRCLQSLMILVSIVIVLGCQPQMCRRKRDLEDGRFQIRAEGCNDAAPRWTRQIALCLNMTVIDLVLPLKDWYSTVYRNCSSKCVTIPDTATDKEDFQSCINCWLENINPSVIHKEGITEADVKHCIDEYIYAYLFKGGAQLDVASRNKYGISLPHLRPAEYWWSVTVRLPCKPRSFQFFNAYCINSFANVLTDKEYALVQNRFVESNEGMTFHVINSPNCIIKPDDIELVYNESVPSRAYPQIGWINNRRRNTNMDIVYDPKFARDLELVDNQGTLVTTDIKKRVKRNVKELREIQTLNEGLSLIGIEFPCSVDSFKATGLKPLRRKKALYGPVNNRYVIDTEVLANFTKTQNSRGSEKRMKFALRYGKSSCRFDAGAVRAVVNPPKDWLSMQCRTCINMPSHSACHLGGKTAVCAEDEVCQTEVRQITKTRKLITKSCKQLVACKANTLRKRKNQISECVPGSPGSVCRCCCDTRMCNDGALPKDLSSCVTFAQ